MITSANIHQRQAARSVLESIKRSNFLAYDLTNDHLIYSKDGVVYKDFLNSTEVSSISGNFQAQIQATSNSLGNYLPLSGGQLTGQLRGTSVSASGNISAANFVTPGSYVFRNSSSAFWSIGADSSSIFIRNLSADASVIDYPFVVYKTGTGKVQIGYSGSVRPVELGGPVTIANLSSAGFIRTNSSGLLTTSPLVSGDIPSLPYIPLSGGNLPTATNLILSTTAVGGDKSLSINSQNGFAFGIYEKSTNLLFGPEFVTTLRTVNITSNVSAYGNISANIFVKKGGTSAQVLLANGSVIATSALAGSLIVSAFRVHDYQPTLTAWNQMLHTIPCPANFWNNGYVEIRDVIQLKNLSTDSRSVGWGIYLNESQDFLFMNESDPTTDTKYLIDVVINKVSADGANTHLRCTGKIENMNAGTVEYIDSIRYMDNSVFTYPTTISLDAGTAYSSRIALNVISGLGKAWY